MAEDLQSPEDIDYEGIREYICDDTVINCLGERNQHRIYRPCTEDEKRTISLWNVFIKQVISICLLSIAVWYLYIERALTNPPRFFEEAFLVSNCLSDSELAGKYTPDGELQFCYIKVTMTILSLVLLIPYWLQTQAQTAIIMVSSINPMVLVPISNGQYAGREFVFDILFDRNPLTRVIIGPFALLWFIGRLARETLKAEKGRIVLFFFVELFFKFIVFALPDLLLTFILFPLSIFVMQASSSTDELFVNLVAVQIFAEIDDILVRILVNPRETVAQSLMVYSRPQKSVLKAKYQPLEEYVLSLNRHNFGFPGANNRMKPLYEYNGFHFVNEV